MKKLKQNWWIIAGFVVLICLQIVTTMLLINSTEQRDQNITEDVLNIKRQLIEKQIIE